LPAGAQHAPAERQRRQRRRHPRTRRVASRLADTKAIFCCICGKNIATSLANAQTKLLETRSKRMSGHASTTRSILAGLGWSYYARFYAWRFS
jgi:hypothetical protein